MSPKARTRPPLIAHWRRSAFAVLFGAAVGVLLLAYVDGAWARYLSQWDPPVEKPHYYQLRTAKWVTAPLAGGLACGLVVWLVARRRPLALALTSSLLCVLTVSSWWSRPGPSGWRDPMRLLPMTQWRCLVAFLPTGAASAVLLGVGARAVARKRGATGDG